MGVVQSHEGGGEASDSCVNNSAGFNIGSPSSVSICSISGEYCNVESGDAYAGFEASSVDCIPPTAVLVGGPGSESPGTSPVSTWSSGGGELDSLTTLPEPTEDSLFADPDSSTASTAPSRGTGGLASGRSPSREAPMSNDGSMTGIVLDVSRFPLPCSTVPAMVGLPVREDDESACCGDPAPFGD